MAKGFADWLDRTGVLHGELRAIADLGRDPRWWLLAGGAALAWDAPGAYVMSDAEPSADTFIGHVEPAPVDLFADAAARAFAARDAIRALDGKLPGQPLAVSIRRTLGGAVLAPNALDAVAVAIGERTWLAPLSGSPSELAADLARAAAGETPRALRTLDEHVAPFACVTLGEEPLATARHGHRRAWRTNGVTSGPWLGLSRAGGLAIASTCHLVIDGYGHAWLADEIRARTAAFEREIRTRTAALTHEVRAPAVVPPPAIPASAIPLAIAWRPLAGAIPSALPLAYALGRLLHRAAGRPSALFSPTFQIPVAPGTRDDPERKRRRVVPAVASVRFTRGEPEPFAEFVARTRALLEREAAGTGLSSHLLAAAQAAPAPLAWKRRAVGASRPRWLDALATMIGGRGCVSRIRLDVPVAPACAVSSPGRLPTPGDPLGGCVLTVVDDGRTGGITLCGAGLASEPADALLDELLAGALATSP